MKISKCCNHECIRWFGNVTGVMIGQKELGEGTICCMKCSKPCEYTESSNNKIQLNKSESGR